MQDTCSCLILYGIIKSKQDALSETILFHYEKGSMYVLFASKWPVLEG